MRDVHHHPHLRSRDVLLDRRLRVRHRPGLARFAADVDWLMKQGVQSERYNLSSEPTAVATTPAVKDALARGTDVLPLVLVGDRVAVEGAYPSRETLAALAGVVVRREEKAPASSAYFSPDGGVEGQ